MMMRGSQFSDKEKAIDITNERSFKFDKTDPTDKFTSSTKQQESNAKELQISGIRESAVKEPKPHIKSASVNK